MTYFVTDGTGFLGRHLVEELLDHREGTIFVLVPESPASTFDRLHRTRWSCSDRVHPVVGDLSAPSLGVDPDWVEQHRRAIHHFFHLAPYDMTATTERNFALNVAGTRAAVDLAGALEAAAFQHVSSVAVAGDYRGGFDETMFAEGQQLPSPYHQTKYESERIVRDECPVPWRSYRPAIVVGHSQTGVMDKIDGPYYFFSALKKLRDTLPQWVPLFGLDLGDTNLVPVDFVAKAMDHLAHLDGLDGRAFHLVDPVPQAIVDVVTTFAAVAKAPRLVVPVDRRITAALPRSLEPGTVLTSVLRTAPAQRALAETIGRLGIPPEVLGQLRLTATFSARATEQALSGSGISCPPIESYAAALWDYWEQHLDTSTASDVALRAALVGRTVVVTDAGSGIGKATALKVAQAGGAPLLVAPGKQGLLDIQGDIEDAGGTAYVYPCDLSDLDAIDVLTEQITAEHRTVDFIVDISAIGVQTNPPRFSAYIASKAAPDAWSRVVSSELIGDGIRFTTIHLPLVRAPMLATTKIYEAFPSITPAQAADLVMDAIKNQPHEINTAVGTAGEVGHALLPKSAFRILHMAYRVFPD